MVAITKITPLVEEIDQIIAANDAFIATRLFDWYRTHTNKEAAVMAMIGKLIELTMKCGEAA